MSELLADAAMRDQNSKRRFLSRLWPIRRGQVQHSIIKARELRAGSIVNGSTVIGIRRCDGSDGLPEKWIGGSDIKSAIAIELRFQDGRIVFAHPDQNMTVTSA